MYASILVALSLVLSPAPGVCRAAPEAPKSDKVLLPPPHRPPPPTRQPLKKKLESTASLTIDTAEAGGEGELLAQRIRGKAEAEMQALHILQGQGGELPQVIVKVVALPGDAIGWSYTIDINHAEQVPIPGGSFRGECQDCTENEVVDKVAGDTRSLLPRLRAYIVDYNAKIDAEARKQAEEDAASNKGAEPGRGGDEGAASPRNDTVDAPPMHVLCKVGIGMMAGGVVAAGLGVGLMLNPDKQVDPNIGYEFRSTRVPGFVTLGVGGAIAVAGAVLFAVGHRKSRAQRTAFVPTFGAGSLGVVWSGRF